MARLGRGQTFTSVTYHRGPLDAVVAVPIVVDLVPAVAGHTAQALDVDKSRAVTAAVESSTAQAIDRDKVRSITAATSSNTAQAIDRDKLVTRSAATSAETARPLVRPLENLIKSRSGVVVYMPGIDQVGSAVAADHSGNGYDFAVVGTVGFRSPDLGLSVAAEGAAIDLNSSGILQINLSTFGAGSVRTLSAWVRRGTDTSLDMIWAGADAGGQTSPYLTFGGEFGLPSSSIYWAPAGNSAASVAWHGLPVEAGDLALVQLTHDDAANTATLWVNGVNQGTQAVVDYGAGLNVTLFGSWYIGSYVYAADMAAGHLAIYDRAMTDAEAEEEYELGSGISLAQEVALVPTTSTNTAVAASYSKPIVKSLTSVATSESAVTLVKPIRKALAAAAQASTAQALDRDKRANKTSATEFEAARPLVVVKTIHKSIAVAASAASAQALDRDKRVSRTAAASTESARPLAVVKTIYKVLASATEAQVAQSFNGDKILRLSPVVETHSATPLSIPTRRSVVPAADAQAAQTLRAAYSRALAATASAEVARALDADKSRTLTHAASSSTARALDFDKRVGLAPASSSESAAVLVKPIRKALAAATSSAVARVLSLAKRGTLTSAAESEAARAMAFSQASDVSTAPAAESDSARALTFSRARTLASATESWSARPLSITKPIARSLVAASSGESARALSGARSLQIAPASGLASAAALVLRKLASLTPASVSSSARPLAFVTSRFSAVEISVAQALSKYKRKSVAPVAIGSSAQPIAKRKAASVAPATSLNLAREVQYVKPLRKTLGRTYESDAARALSRTGRLESAAELDAARALRLVRALQIEPPLLSAAAEQLTFSQPERVPIEAAVEGDAATILVYVGGLVFDLNEVLEDPVRGSFETGRSGRIDEGGTARAVEPTAGSMPEGRI